MLNPGILPLPDPVCRYLGEKKGQGRGKVDRLWAGCVRMSVAKPNTKLRWFAWLYCFLL